MIELYNSLKIILLLFFIQNILLFNLGIAFLKSVSIFLKNSHNLFLIKTVKV